MSVLCLGFVDAAQTNSGGLEVLQNPRDHQQDLLYLVFPEGDVFEEVHERDQPDRPLVHHLLHPEDQYIVHVAKRLEAAHL